MLAEVLMIGALLILVAVWMLVLAVDTYRYP